MFKRKVSDVVEKCEHTHAVNAEKQVSSSEFLKYSSKFRGTLHVCFS